ncbi:unnamed protein product [Larinioides sclopetarius]|uniref:Uncharacterized protein n=1 Tax=Larinioides sclopetarius TaxID=280406 RepID=A0AAV1YZK8_9ARAC
MISLPEERGKRCVEFGNQFHKIAGVDPFTYVTTDSSCVAVHRSNHVAKNIITIVPIEDYVKKAIITKISSDVWTCC